jgi:hypothetical protein
MLGPVIASHVRLPNGDKYIVAVEWATLRVPLQSLSYPRNVLIRSSLNSAAFHLLI